MAELLSLSPTWDGDGDDDDYEEEEEDHDGSATQDSGPLQPYHIFPIESMIPTMFPYYEPTGATVCGHSHSHTIDSASQSVVSNITKLSIASSTIDVDQLAYQECQTTSNDVALLLEDLHTRMLLDELQARESQKEREEIAGTLEYNERIDRLNLEMKDLIGREKKMPRISAKDCRELVKLHVKIGRLAKSIGNTITAKTAYEYALQIRTGGDSEAVARILQELGSLLDEIGEYKHAMERFMQALDIRQRILGENNFLVGKTLYSMGCTIMHQGNADQALDFLQESLDIQRLHLGADAKEIGDILETMGCLLVKCDRLDEALALFESVLRIQRHHIDLFRIASTLKHISSIYKKRQDHGLAVGCIEEWLITMGDLHSNLGHAAEAVKFYREALTIGTSMFSGYYQCKGAAILKAADIYFKNSEIESARPLYANFLQTCETDNTQYYLYALLLLGNCYYSEGNLEEARGCFYNAVDVVHNHDHAAAIDNNVGLLCNGRVQVSSILYKLLREISSTLFDKLVERFKWMTRGPGGSRVLLRGESTITGRSKWQHWLGQRFAKSSQA